MYSPMPWRDNVGIVRVLSALSQRAGTVGWESLNSGLQNHE